MFELLVGALGAIGATIAESAGSGLAGAAGSGLAGMAGGALSGAAGAGLAGAAGAGLAGAAGAGLEAIGGGALSGAAGAGLPGFNQGSEMFSFDFGDPEMNQIAAEGAEAAIAENPKGFLASAWDNVKGAGEQMWDRGKQDVQKLIDSHVVKKPDGSIDGWKTGGNVGYTVLKTAATRALGNAKNGGGLLEQQPLPSAETRAPQARTKDADEALKELMNMIHNS